MLFTLVVGGVLICLVVIWFMRDPYSHIPGPSVLDLMLHYNFDVSKTHLLASEFRQKYGPLFKIPRIGEGPILFVSGLDNISQVAIKEGQLCSGRPTNFRLKSVLGETGILLSYNADNTWKALRKTSQRHIRQFGEGMSRLESIIADIAENMFTDISGNVGEPYDPKRITSDTALKTISFLILGKCTDDDDPTFEKMRQYERIVEEITQSQVPLSIKIIDAFPWLRFFGLEVWKKINRLLQLESEIWQTAKEVSEEHLEIGSMYKVMYDQLQSGDTALTEKDASKTMITLLVAGVVTTSSTFYAMINILAHNPHIQDRIFGEIKNIKEETGRELSFTHRPDMHYTRAALLEMLRYISTAPVGLPHRTVAKTCIGGYDIPENSDIMMLLWDLHHNEDVYENPYTVRPERFLDDDGKVVHADHPSRKNLMPFGAGPRVCLGEVLALTRLFLWLTTMVKRFRIRPAPGNDPSKADARRYEFLGVLKPEQYQVIFEKREN